MNSLREVGRALHAWVVPEQASIPQAWQEFDETGKLKEPKLEERVRQVGRQVARFAYLHLSCQANEFLQNWEKVARESRRRKPLDMRGNEKRAFPRSDELYQESPVESMHWFNPELDDDLKEALTSSNCRTGVRST